MLPRPTETVRRTEVRKKWCFYSPVVYQGAKSNPAFTLVECNDYSLSGIIHPTHNHTIDIARDT